MLLLHANFQEDHVYVLVYTQYIMNTLRDGSFSHLCMCLIMFCVCCACACMCCVMYVCMYVYPTHNVCVGGGGGGGASYEPGVECKGGQTAVHSAEDQCS